MTVVDRASVPYRHGPAAGTRPVVRLRGITKTYRIGKEIEVHALAGVDLDINAGEFVAIMGPSGSGKSTLMNMLGCLDVPTRGTYGLAGRERREAVDDQLAAIRNKHLGFVFQSFNLLARTERGRERRAAARVRRRSARPTRARPAPALGASVSPTA